jgi:glycosyltransferase involved in cell wall biosynthesis
MIKILHITPDFNYSCGRSKLVYFYLKYFSNKKDYQVHFITNGGDSLDRLNDIPNLNFQILKFSTGYKNIFYERNFYRSLKDYIARNKINLIHTHHRFPELISTRISTKLKIKTITSAHSFVKGFKQTSFKSDKIISVSHSLAAYLINEYNISKEKIVSLNNPLDLSFKVDLSAAEKFRKENNISPEMKLLLFIGRVNKDKGFDILLKSFSAVKEKNNDVILMINGQIENNYFQSEISKFNKAVIYIPPQKNNYYLYLLADIVVLPSRFDPFPFVMLETGLHKKPFIGGNTGGIAEFIEDGKNGLLVEPENPDQLADKILFLLNNPEVGTRLGENLYEKVTRLCDYNNYFNEVEKIYNSLIASV